MEETSMKFLILVTMTTSLLACATTTPVAKKRRSVIDCIEELKQNDISSEQSFKICSKIYKL